MLINPFFNNRDYNTDPNIEALKRRGFINHGSTSGCRAFWGLGFRGLGFRGFLVQGVPGPGKHIMSHNLNSLKGVI